MTARETESKPTPLNALRREPGGRMMPYAGVGPAGGPERGHPCARGGGLVVGARMGRVPVPGAAAVTYSDLGPRWGTQG